MVVVVVVGSGLVALYVFSRGAQAEMLAIPSSVWKVCRFHYSLSRFTAAGAMFLHGGPGVRGALCGLMSPGLGSARWERGGAALWPS